MLGYVKHQRSLVSKAKKTTPSSSPSPPVTAVTTAPLVSLPSVTFSEDRIRQLMHSMFQDLMQSARLGTNQPSAAPPAVPDSATKYTEATGGLRSVTPVEAPSTESPGVVLPTNQEDSPPPHTVFVCVSYIARSGVSTVWGSLGSGVSLTLSVSRGTDHLRVINVAPSALSPGSLLFTSPFLILVLPLFLLLPLLILFVCLLLLFPLPPPSLSSSSSFSSSSFSVAPSSFSSGSSFSALAPLRPPPGFPSLPPPLGFPTLPPSVSSPLPSSSLLSASSTPSLASSLPPVCVSSSAGQAASFVAASSFSSSSLDFASVLGLSQDYQYLARWYFQSGGSDFRAYLSAFYPHLFSDASRDFDSGSSVFFLALRAVASSVPLPLMSSAAPPLLSSAPTVSSSQPPAPLPPAPPFSASYSVSVSSSERSLLDPQGWGVSALGSASVVSSAPPGFPPLSAPSSLLSVPPPAVSASPFLPPGVSVLTPPSSSLLSSAPSALSGFSAPALDSSPVVSDGSSVASGPSAFPFPPFYGV